METLSIEILGWLFLAGLVGGFVDSIAGGGGLISVPALMMAGLNPVAALATNKAQAMFGSFTATVTYARKGHVNLADMKWAIAFTAIGSAIGTLMVQYLDSDIMTQVIPFLLIGAAMYFLFGPKIGEVDRHHYLEQLPFYAIFGMALGFYDGFFGPGTGSFWTLAFVAILGFNMLKATAHTKVVNFTSNFTSFLFFAFAGYVMWIPAAVMAVGQLFGARLGANTAMKHGTRVIKPLLVTVSLIITAKLVYDDPDNIIHQLVLRLIS
ncbi:MAG: TSUP family transporter [Magnetovibrio sp.]|nr:TSUP family transporter [Magnetovibrio sp.]